MPGIQQAKYTNKNFMFNLIEFYWAIFCIVVAAAWLSPLNI